MSEAVVESANYHIEVLSDPSAVEASEWNALLATQAAPTPFMRHEFLQALHASGCASAATGWSPAFITVRQAGRLVGAVAAWRKMHSWGEYVFDWAWAQAYERHGLAYYPKLVVASPFSPVPGARLLAIDLPARRVLLQALRQWAIQQRMSSVHLLFADEPDRIAAQAEGWLERSGVQFHWRNREPAAWRDFDDFLAGLQRDKRKKILQERRRVREAGVHFEVIEGAAITPAHWDFFHHCHTLTYQAHGGTPYLSRDFFAHLSRTLPEPWLMFIARRDGRPVAVSLLAIDRTLGVAWGRYWGAVEAIDCLHFEACYYQPLAWCIAQGFRSFEGGAQGAHKIARGLLPVATASAHWLAHPEFSQAVARFLAEEGQGMAEQMDELHERTPFKGVPE